MPLPRTLLQLLICLLAANAHAAAAEAPAQPILEDQYLAGETPALDGPVLGDLAIAGLRPRIDHRVAGDLLAAGGWITIAGAVGDDVRAAGGWLEFDGRIGDHAAIAGIDVLLGPAADIGGRAWLGGHRVRIDGRVRGPLSIAAREVVIAGRIDGPARIVADRLEIRAGARVDGDIVYRTPEPAMVAPGAEITGELAFHRTPFEPREQSDPGTRGGGWSPAGVLGWTLALLLPAALLRLALPSLMADGQRTLRAEPVLSLGIGGLLLVVAPLAALLLCLLLVTIPLALAILLGLVPLALAGYLASAGLLGDAGLARAAPARREEAVGARLGALAVALLALVIAGSIPYIGGLLTIAATLFGTGALAVTVTRGLRQRA